MATLRRPFLSIWPPAALVVVVATSASVHISSMVSAQDSTPLSAAGTLDRRPGYLPHDQIPISPNAFTGSDAERINSAIEQAARTGRRVVIPRRNVTDQGEKDVWLLDSAIVVRSGTTLELENCHIKLSDRCRDNIIRSANCGLGITQIEPMRNVHIYGVGDVLLEGADRPRATGDSGKKLGERTYGTDAGVEGESQTGDWRNIGILLACVENFRIENLRMKDTHAWAISLERCSCGYVGSIQFDSREGKQIAGRFKTILNQDGLNLRLGCHDITIENLSGRTGDDLLALTNTAAPEGGAEPGSTDSTQVSGGTWREGDDLCNIYARNIRGHSVGQHGVVRLLNTRAGKLYNVVLDGVIDTSLPGRPGSATVRIGSRHYGGHVPLGHTRRLFISNVSGASRNTIVVDGTLADSFISNVMHGSDTGAPVVYEAGPDAIRNVVTSNLRTQSTE